MVTHAAGSPSTVIIYVREASTGDACVPIDNRKTVEERSATTGTTNKGALTKEHHSRRSRVTQHLSQMVAPCGVEEGSIDGSRATVGSYGKRD